MAFVATIASAELFTTYDTRNGIAPIDSKYQAINVARTNHPDYFPALRGVIAPALYDTRLNIGVTITGTVNQARADLKAIDDARRPAKMELVNFLGGQTPKQFRQSIKAAYRNVETNTAFTTAQRRALTNVFWAVQADDDFAELRQAKQAEDIDLGIKKEDVP